MSKDGKKSGFGKFLLGAAIGATLGILFAPQEGKKTRAQLKKKLDELIEKAKEIDIVEVKETIERKIKEIKEELAELDAEKALSLAKEKAKAIKEKCDELVKIAIEKGTPVLEKAANEAREATIKVLKGTLAKLEKKDEPKKIVKKVKKDI